MAAALGALALASPLVVAAVPAAAQSISFSISGDGSGDLTVTVTAPAALTSMTIYLTGVAEGQSLQLSLGNFSLQSAAGTSYTYALQDAATSLTGVMPDSYTATADATDGNGDQVSGQAAGGSFQFLAQPVLVLSEPARPVFNTTKPDQAVTFQGQVTGCSTVACPIGGWPAGTTVTITDVTASGQRSWTGATTDSSGDFSVAGVTGIPGHSYSVAVPATATSLAATTSSRDVAHYATTSLTATAPPARYGTQSITGQITYQSGLNQDAAPSGVRVIATSGSHRVRATTGSKGRFTLALPAIAGTTTWRLKTRNDLATTPFLAGTASPPISATQLWPVKITGFTASLDKFGLVTVAGCLSAAVRVAPQPEYPQVQIQWRGRRSGRWLMLGTVGTTHVAGCAGASFAARGDAPAASAYYRARFPGGNVYASAVSARTERVWIYQTRFRRFRAVPRRIRAGKNITVGGTLQYRGSKWRGLGRQPVWIVFSPDDKDWYLFGRLRTHRRGSFSVSFPDAYGTGYWSANFQGNRRHLDVWAPACRVRVRGGASPALTSLARRPARLRPAGLSSAPDRSAGGRQWPFVLAADPLLLLMGK